MPRRTGQTNFTLSRIHRSQSGMLQSMVGVGTSTDGHGMDGRSRSGHGMSQSGRGTLAMTQATTRAPMIGTTTTPTPPATWRAEWRRGFARIFSSRTAAGEPGSGTRSIPPVPTQDAVVAAVREPSNHVARTGLPSFVNRTRTAPTSSASACSFSAARERLSSDADFFDATSSSSTHHVAWWLHPPPADASTRWCRPFTVSSKSCPCVIPTSPSRTLGRPHPPKVAPFGLLRSKGWALRRCASRAAHAPPHTVGVTSHAPRGPT